ncbi:TPA: hypothetical protein ACGO1W_001092 [Streptococcus suis]
MEFKITKKYLLDIASLRLDCKVREINRERKVVSNREYYWEHGINKKQKPKYSMLSNEEIYSSNAPLIGQIRSGKINKKILIYSQIQQSRQFTIIVNSIPLKLALD